MHDEWKAGEGGYGGSPGMVRRNMTVGMCVKIEGGQERNRHVEAGCASGRVKTWLMNT